MNPEQLEKHALSEIDRAESLLELLRTQNRPVPKAIADRLNKLAYSASVLTEPVSEEEVEAIPNGG